MEFNSFKMKVLLFIPESNKKYKEMFLIKNYLGGELK